jgi:hypothetical protein
MLNAGKCNFVIQVEQHNDLIKNSLKRHKNEYNSTQFIQHLSSAETFMEEQYQAKTLGLYNQNTNIYVEIIHNFILGKCAKLRIATFTSHWIPLLTSITR